MSNDLHTETDQRQFWPLSTFTRSQYNMHEEAVRLLLRQLTGEITNPMQIVVPVIPLLRESTQRGGLAHIPINL